MNDLKWLAEEFEAHRLRLRGVAYRMLGSRNEADDAVQEAWLRLSRSDTSGVGNFGGWLTTVVARVCLDILRARKSRREDSMDAEMSESIVNRESGTDPEQETLLADSVGLALLVVLEKLEPAERVAFVLHDMFDISFQEIAPIVGRSPTAARQLASRARRRVQAKPSVSDVALARQRKIVDAFLSAARNGDFAALVAVLDPDVVLRADSVAVRLGGPSELRGAPAVANLFKGRAAAAKPSLVNGALGIVVAPRGRLLLVLNLTMTGGKISGIDVIAEPDRLSALDLSVFGS